MIITEKITIFIRQIRICIGVQKTDSKTSQLKQVIMRFFSNLRLIRSTSKFTIIALFILLFSSCANTTIIEECVLTDPYGFWSGLWHGIITPFSFIGSLFRDDISVYAVNNSGGWYDFGFLLGVGGLGFSTSKTKR